MEQDERFSIGKSDELSAVTFGLFAAEKLTAADGSIIPADGLLEIVSWTKTVMPSARPICRLAATISKSCPQTDTISSPTKKYPHRI